MSMFQFDVSWLCIVDFTLFKLVCSIVFFYLNKTKQAQLFNCNAVAMLPGDVNMLRSCSLHTARARVLRSLQHLKNQAALRD